MKGSRCWLHALIKVLAASTSLFATSTTTTIDISDIPPKKPLSPQVSPNVLFAVSSYWDPKGGTKSGLAHGMRATQRDTWIKWLDDTCMYYFFVHDVPNLKGIEAAEHDVVVIPPSEVQICSPLLPGQQHHCRSGRMLRYILVWALKNTNANFIVTVEHDEFVCVSNVLDVIPFFSSQALLARWHPSFSRAREGECPMIQGPFLGGTEQTFVVYGRALAASMTSIMDRQPRCYIPTISWCGNTRPLVQWLQTTGGEIEIIPDQDRILIDGAAFEAWSIHGPPFRGAEGCPASSGDLVKDKGAWAESACACGALSHHLRGDARHGNMALLANKMFARGSTTQTPSAGHQTAFATISGGNSSSKSGAPESNNSVGSVPMRRSGHKALVRMPPLPSQCFRDSCPAALTGREGTLENSGRKTPAAAPGTKGDTPLSSPRWWRCPSHELDGRNVTFSEKDRERLRACAGDL